MYTHVCWFRYLRYGHVTVPIHIVSDLRAEADYYHINIDFSGIEKHIDRSPVIVSEPEKTNFYRKTIIVNGRVLSKWENENWQDKELTALNYTHYLVKEHSYRVTGSSITSRIVSTAKYYVGTQSYFLEKDVPDKITIPLSHAQ